MKSFKHIGCNTVGDLHISSEKVWLSNYLSSGEKDRICSLLALSTIKISKSSAYEGCLITFPCSSKKRIYKLGLSDSLSMVAFSVD